MFSGYPFNPFVPEVVFTARKSLFIVLNHFDERVLKLFQESVCSNTLWRATRSPPLAVLLSSFQDLAGKGIVDKGTGQINARYPCEIPDPGPG